MSTAAPCLVSLTIQKAVRGGLPTLASLWLDIEGVGMTSVTINAEQFALLIGGTVIKATATSEPAA